MSTDKEKSALEAIELAMIRMSPRARRSVEEYLQSLTHYRDSTVGLWVTDKPRSVEDKALMFQLKF